MKRHGNGNFYPTTISCGVVATSIEDAIATFKAEHPDATLWTVSHRGKIEIITPSAVSRFGSV